MLLPADVQYDYNDSPKILIALTNTLRQVDFIGYALYSHAKETFQEEQTYG